MQEDPDQKKSEQQQSKPQLPDTSPETNNPHRRLGMKMIVAMWVIVIGMLTMFFQSWQEKQYNPNQSAVISSDDGQGELVLQRNRYGHYVASGYINQQPVVFLLDTGASDISVPEVLAQKIGLKRGRAMQYQTANGMITVYEHD